MKIVHLTPDLNFAVKFVFPIADLQSENGHKVFIFTDTTYYLSSLEGFNFNDLSHGRLSFFKINLRSYFNIPLYLFILFRLIRELRLIGPDLVISHTSLSSFAPLIISRLFTSAKLVYFNHGLPFLGYRFLWRLSLKLLEFSNLKIADLTVTVGEAMFNCLQSLNSGQRPLVYASPGSAAGIQIITSNYEYLKQLRLNARLEFGISTNERVVIYVGRPVKRKGFFDLLSAWDVFKHSSNYRLLIVGSTVSDIANARISLPQNINFVGYIDSPNKYYLLSDVLCIPSYHEGLGYCYLEAASAGSVPICASIPGPTDFIKNGYNGLTCKAGDIQSISNAISLILSNNQLRDELAANAFYSSLEYDSKKIASKVLGHIESIL